jgi:methyl-accepting chemotaxis protein
MSQTEVGAKLVLDDHASEALEKVKEGFEKVSEKVSEVQHEAAGMFKQMIATAAGFQLSASIDGVKELAGEFMDAAKEVGAERKELASLLAMNDKAGRSMLELKEDARELHDNLEGMAADLGVSTATVMDTFEMIASRSNKSTEQIKEFTGQVALAGRVVPGGAESIAAAFRDLETGIVRPKNALVQLMKQSGLVGGNTKQIAHGLMQMAQSGPEGLEKAFKLAEKAIEKMADKGKQMPMGFGAVTSSLKDLRTQMEAVVGEPMLAAMVGPLRDLRKYLLEHREAIEHFAKTMGEKVGHWMTEAAKKIEEGFKYLQSHADEISKAIETAVGVAKDVFEFVLAHKEEIAIAFGVKAVAPVVGGAVSGAMGVGKAIAGVTDIAGLVGGLAQGGVGLTAMAAAAVPAAIALGAFAAAVGAVGLAVSEGSKLMKEMKHDQDVEVQSRLNFLKSHAMGGGTEKEMQRVRDELVMLDPHLVKVADDLLKTSEMWAQFDKGLEDLGNKGDASTLVDNFGKAADAQSDFQMDQIAKTFATNANLRNHLDEADEAFDKFGEKLIEHVKKFSEEQAKLLQYELDSRRAAKASVEEMKGGNKPAAPMQIFNGPITIKQDFKDQDPDRIALIFRRDLAKHATARTSANTTGPFGGF